MKYSDVPVLLIRDVPVPLIRVADKIFEANLLDEAEGRISFLIYMFLKETFFLLILNITKLFD